MIHPLKISSLSSKSSPSLTAGEEPPDAAAADRFWDFTTGQ